MGACLPVAVLQLGRRFGVERSSVPAGIRGNDRRNRFDLTVIVGMKIDVIRAWRQHAIEQRIEPLFHFPDELEDDGPPRRPLPSLHTGSMVGALL